MNNKLGKLLLSMSLSVLIILLGIAGYFHYLEMTYVPKDDNIDSWTNVAYHLATISFISLSIYWFAICTLISIAYFIAYFIIDLLKSEKIYKSC